MDGFVFSVLNNGQITSVVLVKDIELFASVKISTRKCITYTRQLQELTLQQLSNSSCSSKTELFEFVRGLLCFASNNSNFFLMFNIAGGQ